MPWRSWREQPTRPVWAGHALFHLGLVAYARREWDRAVRLLTEAVRLYEATAERSSERPAALPGPHRLRARRVQRGRRHHGRVLRRLRLRGSEPALADGLADVATLAAFRGDFAVSARLFGAAAGLLETGGGTYSLPGRDTYERAEATARQALTEQEWQTAFAAGRAMPLDLALAEAEAVLTAAVKGERRRSASRDCPVTHPTDRCPERRDQSRGRPGHRPPDDRGRSST